MIPLPTRRAVALSCAVMVLAVLPALGGEGLAIPWAGAVGAILLAIGLDALGAARGRDLTVRAETPAAIEVGEHACLGIEILSAAPAYRLEVLADLTEPFDPRPVQAAGRLFTGGTVHLDFPLRPRRRGTGRVASVWLRWTGPLGLAARMLRVELGREIHVVPAVRAVQAAAMRHLSSAGLPGGPKARRMVGEGSAFDSLREFLPGHDHRAIDWKASARHMKLLVREFREECDHQIVMAFDTGHVMGEPMAGIPRLDHALRAGLLLAFAGLKAGDRVGLFAFDEQVRLHAPPRGGVSAFAGLQRLAAGLEGSTGETNFTLGLMTLLGRLSRRTLVVLFTEFMDSVMVELMVENLGRLSARHLVLCVTLRDPDLLRVAARRPDSASDLNRAVVAGDLLRDRDLAIRRLRRRGVQCIDVAAEELSGALLDRYLLVKKRELL
jgi:uncharacterized protein (DUF58 family)